MKRKLALVLAMLMLLTLATACGAKTSPSPSTDAGGATASPAATTPAATTPAATTAPPASAAPAGPKNLTIQLGPDTETIDPAINSSVDGANYIIFAFEGLLTVDKDGKIAPGQAETWEKSADGLTWTFHLRDGLKWSDGTPLTANDFVYSWKRMADPATAAPYASTVLSMVVGFDKANADSANIDQLGVSAPDDHTFVVNLTWPCPYFDRLAAFASLFPVQQATVEANGDAWAASPATYISNGPFMLTDWVPGSYLLFSKNPNYWNADAVKLDTIKCLLIEDDNASLAAYQSGTAQMIKSIPSGEIDALSKTADYHLDPILGTYYIDLNTSLDMFKDSRVREALSLAIDRIYVAGTLMQNTYMPAGNFVGPGVADWDGSDFYSNANGGKPYIDVNTYDANLAQAKQLMADAGYPNGKGFPTLKYSFNDTGYHKVVAEYLQQAWGQLGINVELSVEDWASFLPMRRVGDYVASRDGWVCDYNDPSNILELRETGNGNNAGSQGTPDKGYSNKDFDAAMQQSRTLTDPQQRWAALHQAEDVLMKDAGVIPVAYYADFYLIQPNAVTGWWHSPDGFWHFEFADLAA